MRKLKLFRFGWRDFKKLPIETLTPVIESAFAPIVTVVCVHEERYTGITNCLGWTVQDGQDATVKVVNQPKKAKFSNLHKTDLEGEILVILFDLDMDYQLQFYLSLQLAEQKIRDGFLSESIIVNIKFNLKCRFG